MRVQRNAQDDIPGGHAEQKCSAKAGGEERVVPGPPAELRGHLPPHLDARRAEDEHDQQEHEARVEAAEQGRVGIGEHGEHGPSERHQPDLVPIPERADGVDRQPPLGLVLGDERVQDADPEVEAVEDGVAGQEHPEQEEPDDNQQLAGERIGAERAGGRGIGKQGGHACTPFGCRDVGSLASVIVLEWPGLSAATSRKPCRARPRPPRTWQVGPLPDLVVQDPEPDDTQQRVDQTKADDAAEHLFAGHRAD